MDRVWEHRRPSSSAVYLYFAIITACATQTRDDTKPLELSPPELSQSEVKEQTVLPENFRESFFELPKSDLVKIPKSMLTTGTISRNRAEMRVGPGTQFDLLDATLLENDSVIIFDTRGVWSKIISQRLGVIGWVHQRAVSIDGRRGSEPLLLPVNVLPTVIAVEQVNHIYTFGAQVRTPVTIDRGTQFLALQKSNGRVLVWIVRTNSAAWVSEDFVK